MLKQSIQSTPSKSDSFCISSGSELKSLLPLSLDVNRPISLDVETKGLDPSRPTNALLGVSVDTGLSGAFYVPLFHWDREFGRLLPLADLEILEVLKSFLRRHRFFVGHNFTYDEEWIWQRLGVKPAFKYDTQIMWHLSTASYTKRKFGLKAAQKEILGWAESNEKRLHDSIIANGGSPKNGDFYLADLPILAEYAALDAKSTREVFFKLRSFFDQHSYWHFHDKVIAYKRLLLENTRDGVRIDWDKLNSYIDDTKVRIAQLQRDLHTVAGQQIQELEKEWKEKQAAAYKTEKGRERFLENEAKHPRFNLNSNPHLSQLLHEKLDEKVLQKTEKGAPKVDKAALQQMRHPAAKVLLEFSSKQKTLEYAEAYLAARGPDGKIHPGFNVTGTVSGRLSGFSPNLQQLPIDEKELMECFLAPPDCDGIHYDFVSIEPFWTAYFSQDPTLLKVYLHGKGDIYLDLALALFPENEDLRNEYDPNGPPPSGELKSRFKEERDLAKLVHLACQYGGGSGTIQSNLVKRGIPCSRERAQKIVSAYWQKFSAVKTLEKALYNEYRQNGYLLNPFGRLILLPDIWCKDLLNRFIQSTAHDSLMEWILTFAPHREFLGLKPVILDWHDSTSWAFPKSVPRAKVSQFFEEFLRVLNARLGLDMPIRAEGKFWSTFAGLK